MQNRTDRARDGWRGIVGVVLGTLLLMPAVAMAASEAVVTQDPATTTEAQVAKTSQAPLVLRGSRLLDMPVDDVTGELIGEVTDFAIRVGDGRVSYVVLRHGATLGVGGTPVAIAWTRFDIHERERLVVDMARSQVELLPAFDENADWPSDVSADQRDESAEAEGLRVQDVVRGSKLIGLAVRNMTGEDLGHVDDLAVVRESGEVAYAVVAHGGVFGVGDDYVAVPLDRMTLDATEGILVLDVTAEQLEDAPSFEGLWPERVSGPFGEGPTR